MALLRKVHKEIIKSLLEAFLTLIGSLVQRNSANYTVTNLIVIIFTNDKRT